MANLVLSAKCYMFTWSRCAATEDDAREFQCEVGDKLERLFPNALFSVGVELHAEVEDKPFHVHAGVIRENSKQMKLGKRLDIRGVHPNIKVHKRDRQGLKSALEYPCKEDEMPLFNWDEDVFGTLLDEIDGENVNPNCSTYKAREDSAMAAAMEAPSYDDAMELLRNEIPAQFVFRQKDIQAYFKNFFKPPFEIKYAMDTFNKPPIDWASVNDRASVVIIGDPQMGKTFWALAHFRCPLFVSDIDKLREFNPTHHDGIVFDDFSCSHWPMDPIKNLFDRELARDIRCRYQSICIPAGTKKIFCTNNIDSLRHKEHHLQSEADQQAVESRQHLIYVTERLF